MLDIHQLNVFLASAETLNFTKAAEKLHMTQPSISQHIQTLERHFGIELFLRNGRNLELTDAGLALVPLAREAVTLSVRVDETMESLKGIIHGHLIVGCSTTPGKYLLPQLLARFHKKYPQVRVTCQVSPQADALRNVLDGSAHFALFSLEKAGSPEIEAIPFQCDPIVLIASLDHPWAQREEIEPSELLEADFILRESSSGTFIAVRDALAKQAISLSDLNTLLTLGNSEAIALAVQEGIGVGFISKIIVNLLARDRVVEVKIRDTEICRQIYAARNRHRPATGAQTAFWNFLTSAESRMELPAH